VNSLLQTVLLIKSRHGNIENTVFPRVSLLLRPCSFRLECVYRAAVRRTRIFAYLAAIT
jgi:hypothetical protein